MFGARSWLCLHMCTMFLLSWKWDTSHIFFGGTLTPAMFVFARLWKSFCRPIRGLDGGQIANKRPPWQVPVRNWVSLMWPRVLVVTCYSVHVKCHGQQSEKFTAGSFRRRERLAVNLIFTSHHHSNCMEKQIESARNKNIYHSCWCNNICETSSLRVVTSYHLMMRRKINPPCICKFIPHSPSLFRCHPL